MSEEKDIEPVLDKEDMYQIWIGCCPDKERLKEDFFKAYKQSAIDSGWVDPPDEDLEPHFESWYQEFKDKITNGKC